VASATDRRLERCFFQIAEFFREARAKTRVGQRTIADGLCRKIAGLARLFVKTIAKMRHELSVQTDRREAVWTNKRGAEAPLELQRRNPLDQRLLDRRLVN
jgi:hypothetical protein